jgi:hypothetical protein
VFNFEHTSLLARSGISFDVDQCGDCSEAAVLTMNPILKVIGTVSIAALTVAAVAETSALAQSADSIGVNANWVVPLGLLLVGVILVVKFFKRRAERAEEARVRNAMTEALEPIAPEFPFLFSGGSYSETKPTLTYLWLCMDRDGERLRFLEFSHLDGRKLVDFIVPISNIVSVELSGGNEVVTDYETTSTKPNALPGAILGHLLFGRTGAIVGATAAGSEETTVATQRVVEKPSVLVFELSDLNNPVMRFYSMDHAQCDLWLHRVRSAMARHAKAASSANLPTGQGAVTKVSAVA